ncbi:hypothetical protein [Pseudomonas sp. S4_EA_1b]|uniref:hypothetical protein n=1 Tax=Pseudomonas sp. S4_EA_1b TaxID=2796960 RepID=UPI0018E5C0A6|nr:hypothetical protein [Pseudomonas sp. S4_EA_1b]MBI6603291.1 hypothetical protein [Pseudomonas sp. S4_EA_1b]
MHSEKAGAATAANSASGVTEEQAEVVAYMFIKPDGKLMMDAVRHKPSQPAEAVMTVKQHKRIVATQTESLRSQVVELRSLIVDIGVDKGALSISARLIERMEAALLVPIPRLSQTGTAQEHA